MDVDSSHVTRCRDAKAEDATSEEFHAELFERIVENCLTAKFPFLTAEDIAGTK